MRGRERRTAGHGRETQAAGIEVREAAADSTACQMEKSSSAVTIRATDTETHARFRGGAAIVAGAVVRSRA
jgi:hypothetical protein